MTHLYSHLLINLVHSSNLEACLGQRYTMSPLVSFQDFSCIFLSLHYLTNSSLICNISNNKYQIFQDNTPMQVPKQHTLRKKTHVQLVKNDSPFVGRDKIHMEWVEHDIQPNALKKLVMTKFVLGCLILAPSRTNARAFPNAFVMQ